MNEIHSRKIDDDAIDTILQDDVVFVGSAVLDKNFAVRGRFVGDIECKNDIYFDAESTIEANIKSLGSVYIQGHVVGDIVSNDRIELIGESILTGNVITGRMVIETGSEFNGFCQMRDRLSTPEAIKEENNENNK